MKILIVEDEKRLAEAVAQLLRQQNYTVDIAFDGADGLDMVTNGSYDLLILDIMLPIMDGIKLLTKLRADEILIPILMLTAMNSVPDRIKGLDKGADDYLVKPFDSGELIARVRALLRRKWEYLPDGMLDCGNLRLDHDRLVLRCGDDSLSITKKEADLLEYLMLREGHVLTKGQITEKLWGYDSEMEYNNVEVYVSFIRKKLKHLGACVGIRTMRGHGYMLERKNDV